MTTNNKRKIYKDHFIINTIVQKDATSYLDKYMSMLYELRGTVIDNYQTRYKYLSWIDFWRFISAFAVILILIQPLILTAN